MQALVQKALAPVLPTLAVDIVAGYSHLHPARLFAEGLYEELYKGQTRILFRELYNVKKNALREPHVFWQYLGQATLPTFVVLKCMLEAAKEKWRAQNARKHCILNRPLGRFARLVGKKFPFAGFFMKHYIRCARAFIMNVSMDEWPQVLHDKFYYGHLLASRVHFFLVHSRKKQLRRTIKALGTMIIRMAHYPLRFECSQLSSFTRIPRHLSCCWRVQRQISVQNGCILGNRTES